jgi:hypothetical protein
MPEPALTFAAAILYKPGLSPFRVVVFVNRRAKPCGPLTATEAIEAGGKPVMETLKVAAAGAAS